MRLVPSLVSMAIALAGLIIGLVLLSRKQTQRAILILVSSAVLSMAILRLWRV